MIPTGFQDRRLLVLVDFSGWLHVEFHAVGIDGMVRNVVRRLHDLLADPAPPYVALALDSSPTWRHALTRDLEPTKRYKANRPRKAPEFVAACNRCVEIAADLYRVPVLWADGFEADDVFAAAEERAAEAGLDLAILSADKDLCQLLRVRADESIVVRWDGWGPPLVPAEVVDYAPLGVPPSLVHDFLAIVGDNADNVPGVEGLGPVAARAIVNACGSLEAALCAPIPPRPIDEIKRLERERAKAKRAGKDLVVVSAQLEELRAARDLADYLETLQRSHEDARLSYELVRLDPTAPIDWDLQGMAVGDFDIDGLRKLYTELGLTRKAHDLRYFPKEAA